jgi:hypothetical protein
LPHGKTAGVLIAAATMLLAQVLGTFVEGREGQCAASFQFARFWGNCNTTAGQRASKVQLYQHFTHRGALRPRLTAALAARYS